MLPPVPGLRRATEQQLHVTLAFIGEVGLRQQSAARAVVEAIPPGLGGVAALSDYLFLPSPRRTRVVALAIVDPQQIFTTLFEAVMTGLEAEGVMKREKRPFRAHLTIARLRPPSEIRPKMECGRAVYPVSSVCLYRSELRREGARYTVQACRQLTSDDGL